MANTKGVVDLHKGEFIKIDDEICKVIEVDKKSGGGQFGSIVHVKYVVLSTGSYHDRRFNPADKVEVLDVQTVKCAFSYKDQDTFYFMDETTYEQYEIRSSVLGKFGNFLKENDEVEVIVYDGRAISVNKPEKIKVKVEQTGEVSSGTDKSVWKPALIEGGIEIMVPGFIKTGDTIVIDTEKFEYVGRE
ncbi:MAG: elongation factor P [Brevinematia bacterium]